ncbi:hypothetical protein [Shewanella dokdonensis]|uniref:Uncharacterized protein n=1 Tax=Shewanella dokdonensis TaxID=712036 RepID=A0ABX8DHX0_9GAMM|nr:hypothetical protein [Shewanella dokdonensis]MCL1075112.1 hypothetical protein [Shewanella dokdonensis]QVK23517.1 hypothetical protein KHX94_01700 [Shewanella dokdonensis]
MKERYGYASWFFEWLLACLACLGVYVVAFKQPIFNQMFWWAVLFFVILSSFMRMRSYRFQNQLKQLTLRQALFVKAIMVIYTLPIIIMLLINVTNSTGVWDM